MRTRPLAAAIAAAALLAGACTSTPGRGPEQPTPSTEDETGGEDAAGEDAAEQQLRTITVYVDGWSWRTLDRPVELGWQAAGTSGRARLAAADADTIADAPADVLTRVVARMVTADTDLRCTAAGCTASNGDIDVVAALTGPATIDGLGVSYRHWQIPAGLYVATFDVPDDAGRLTLTANGFTGAFPIAGTYADEGSGTDDEAQVLPYDVAAHRGYGTGTFTVAAAFGRLFTPTPDWLAHGVSHRDLPGILSDDTDDDPQLNHADAQAVAAELARGLNTRSGMVSTVTDAALTRWSSPTYGCGPAIVCTPATAREMLDVTDVAATQVEQVCDARAGTHVLAVITDQRWELTDATKPFHQLGLYGGRELDPFGGDTPLLATAGSHAHVQAAYLVGIVDGQVGVYEVLSRTDADELGTWDAATVTELSPWLESACPSSDS